MNIKSLILVAGLAVLGTSSAFACNTPKPKPNCTCVGNQWVENTVNNTNYNTTNNTNYNTTDNSVKSNSTASATVGNISATGGNSVATGGSASIAAGAVQNTNNVTGGNSSASIAAGAVQNTVTGGAGGSVSLAAGAVAGGQGGAGGSVSNSGNSQQQQSQTLNNSGNSTIAAGAVQNTNTATASNNGNNSNNADNSSTNTASGNVTEVTVEGDTTVYKAARIPVSTAYAASLTSGMDTCLGSASGGVQLPLVGLSLGKTTLDKGCKLIKETHLLREGGSPEYEAAACYRMRAGKEGKDIDNALKLAGIDCKVKVVVPEVVTKTVQGPTVFVEVPTKKKGQ